MNRTIKEGEAEQKLILRINFLLNVKRYHYDTHQQLRRHLADFVTAYNFARRLKTLKGLTPYEFICKRWTIEPERLILNRIHLMPGLNTQYHSPVASRMRTRVRSRCRPSASAV